MSRRRFAAAVLGTAALGTLAEACGSDGPEPTASSNLPGGDVKTLAYSGDGKTLFFGDDVGEVFSWDPASHVAATKRMATQYPTSSDPAVGAVAVGPDGSFLVVAARTLEIWNAADLTRTAAFWSPKDGELLPPPSWWKTASDDEGLRYSVAVAVSPDGSTVVDGLYSGAVRVWDRKSGKQTAELPGGTDIGSVIEIAFSHDGKRVAATFAAPIAGQPQGAVVIWDLASRQKTGSLDVASGGVLFRPDGGLCVSTVRGVMFLDASGTAQGPPLTDSPRIMALSSDGAILALGNGPTGEKVELWDVGARRPNRTFRASGYVSSLAFAPSGRALAAGTGSGTVQVWDTSTS